MLNIIENEPLSKYTTFRLGGPAKFFVEVKTAEELEEALNWTKEKNEKYFILGGGSNLLFSDAGFDGLIIKIAFSGIEISGNAVRVGAGVPLFLLIKKTTEAGLAGLENLAGIPGTVGGAVVNNAGAYGSSIGEFFKEAELLYRDGKKEKVDKSWMRYEYRASRIKYWEDGQKPVILSVSLELKNGDSEALNEKIKEILTQRTKTPKGFCAGCAFKNIKDERVAETLDKCSFTPAERELFASRHAIPAGWFIDKMDLKGKKIGGAYVASEHANYIMNDGSARAEDVIALISYVKQQVRDKFGIQLEEEVETVL